MDSWLIEFRGFDRGCQSSVRDRLPHGGETNIHALQHDVAVIVHVRSGVRTGSQAKCILIWGQCHAIDEVDVVTGVST